MFARNMTRLAFIAVKCSSFSMLNTILAVALVGFAASALGMKAAGEADLLASPPTQEELATVHLDTKIL